jgi:hypothetical protein
MLPLPPPSADVMQFRCMEHSLHLAAGHFVKGVAPTSSHKLLKDRGESGDGEEAADDDNGGVEHDAADSIGKALALVNQVCVKVSWGFYTL